MKYLKRFNARLQSDESPNVVDLVENERETYNTFHALKRMWKSPDEIIATVTLILGDLNDCDELLELYDSYKMEGSEHPLEDAILDFFRTDSWQLSDFAYSYPSVIDGDYLMKEGSKR